MARSIFECRRATYGDSWCAFAKLKKDSVNGKLYKCGCLLGFKDHYNIYPEHNDDGTLVYNRDWNSTDPFPPGINVIWENDTPHETGLTFNMTNLKTKKSRLRPEDFNFHPLYTIKDINEPYVTGGMESEHVGYAFGGTDISLSPSGWRDQLVRGIERTEPCNAEIYAEFSPSEGAIHPRCLRDWSAEFKHWNNYTVFPERKKTKTFFPCEEDEKVISHQCREWFGDTVLAKVMQEAFFEVKAGEYINLRDLMRSNGVHENMVKKVMTATSTHSKEKMYRKMTLRWYYLYYRALDRMGLPKGKLMVYKANLINYVLNYPPLAEIDPERPPLARRKSIDGLVPTNRRYWWACRLVQDAWIEGKRAKRPLIKSLPKWLMRQQNYLKTNTEHLYKGSYPAENCDNPAVLRIGTLINLKPTKSSWKPRRQIFADILLAGQRWNTTEVKETWKRFTKAYDAQKPDRFWNWVRSVRLATPLELDKMTEEGKFSLSRTFSTRLLESMVSIDSFKVRKTKLEIEEDRFIEINGLRLCPSWFFTKGKPGWSKVDIEGNITPERSELFYIQLKKVWYMSGKKGEDLFEQYKELLATLPPDQSRQFLADVRNAIAEDVMLGTELGTEDLGPEIPYMKIIDLEGTEVTNDRSQSWDQELESLDYFKSYPTGDDQSDE